MIRNIRLGKECLPVPNTLTGNAGSYVTSPKSFISFARKSAAEPKPNEMQAQLAQFCGEKGI